MLIFRVKFRSGLCSASAVVLISAFAGCDFFNALFSPHNISHSNYIGLVRRESDSAVLFGVRVELRGIEAQSDSEGQFSFSDVMTGPAPLRLSKAGFFSVDTEAAIYLPENGPADPPVFYLRQINFPPSIDTLFSQPALTRARDDTVAFVLRCNDTYGDLAKAILAYGDGYSDTLLPDTCCLADTLRHVYPAAGQYTARLTVFDGFGDSTVGTVRAQISANRRPEAEILIPSRPFYVNRYNWITINVNDSDANFDYLTIDWGDKTPIDTVYSLPSANQYYHKYVGVQSETRFPVIISLKDEAQAQSIYVRSILVDILTPPIIEDPLKVEPRNIQPGDSVFTASVRVFQVEGYVSEILWRVSTKSSPVGLIARDVLDSAGGTVTGGVRIFSHTFPTQELRDSANQINVKVTDIYGGSSDASVTFFKW